MRRPIATRACWRFGQNRLPGALLVALPLFCGSAIASAVEDSAAPENPDPLATLLESIEAASATGATPPTRAQADDDNQKNQEATSATVAAVPTQSEATMTVAQSSEPEPAAASPIQTATTASSMMPADPAPQPAAPTSAPESTTPAGPSVAPVPVVSQAAPAPMAEPAAGQMAPDTSDIELRRPQGEPPLTDTIPVIDPSQVPPPEPYLPRESIPLPDRWRIMETLGFKDNYLDPYHQSLLKADKPLPEDLGLGLGPDWFFNASITSDTVAEWRRIPNPVSAAGSISSGTYDVLGRGISSTFDQTFLFDFSLIKGDTTFKPPDFELRLVPAFDGNISHAQEAGVLEVDPADGLTRRDSFGGLQEAYTEFHLRNVSDRYDFDSMRFGIQPFTSDFRGFVFQDEAFGVRFFGNRDNNTWQYNLAWLRRLEKDTNSGLNDITVPMRHDETFIANVFHQDFPVQGHTTEFIVMHNENHDEGQYIDSDGFIQRPALVGDEEAHHYEVTYVGLNGDGHFGRWNLTTSVYGVFGHDSHNPIAERAQSIAAGFAAAELSRDFDWIRIRGSAVYATGDKNPNDGRATGFDAILENPDIAGAGTSFWIRQAIPLIGGGGVTLSGREGLLPDLRSSKDAGQSNFVNPGLFLIGLGADADLTPNLRLLGNVSHLSFATTAVLDELRAQANISRDIGTDLSSALQYRPFLTQNIVFSASVAALLPGTGFKELYNTDRLGIPYSLLFNMVLRY